MYLLLLGAIVISAAPQFEVQPLDGPQLTGRLVGLDAKQVVLDTPQGRVSLEIAKVASIAPKEKPAALGREPGVRIELIDGSTLLAEQYTASQGRARIVFPGGEAIETSTRAVATVRFQSGFESITAEWSRIVGMKLQNDLLVTSKGENLDYHKGVIRDVTDKQVQFDLDGEVVPVKRGKLFGLVYYHAAESEQPEATSSVLDAAGSRWSGRSLALSGALEITTPAGLTVRRPLDQIAQIDLSRGKIIYLSDLQPESVKYTPYFAVEKEVPARLEFFRPRQDRNLEMKPLRLGGRQFPKGLALHSRTEIVYSLPGRFSRLEAVAGIDDGVRPRGNVRLVLRGDDKILLETTLKGNDPPKPIEVDLAGVRRLVVLADFGEDMDVAGHLDLGDARIIK
jgi:hypothetical protein